MDQERFMATLRVLRTIEEKRRICPCCRRKRSLEELRRQHWRIYCNDQCEFLMIDKSMFYYLSVKCGPITGFSTIFPCIMI